MPHRFLVDDALVLKGVTDRLPRGEGRFGVLTGSHPAAASFDLASEDNVELPSLRRCSCPKGDAERSPNECRFGGLIAGRRG
jgi:hypothetical protein